MTDCDLCRKHPLKTCPWHDPDRIPFNENRWQEYDERRGLSGFDIPEEYGGLQVSHARYVNYLRERELCRASTSTNM